MVTVGIFEEELKLKKHLMLVAFATLLATSASAQTIGVSMALFDDNFLTVLRNGMTDYAKTKQGVTLQVEDAQNDVGKQLSQVQNFVASGVDAIVVNPVDTDGTAAISQAAAAAGIPLVYVNRQPANVDQLPEKQAFVASDEGIWNTSNQGSLPHSQGSRQERSQSRRDDG
jgi:ribose transport system substrate-binding protein/inositol transport system substrate-binding protein